MKIGELDPDRLGVDLADPTDRGEWMEFVRLTSIVQARGEVEKLHADYKAIRAAYEGIRSVQDAEIARLKDDLADRDGLFTERLAEVSRMMLDARFYIELLKDNADDALDFPGAARRWADRRWAGRPRGLYDE